MMGFRRAAFFFFAQLAAMANSAVPQNTAVYDGFGLANTTSETLAGVLRARGARNSSQRLYRMNDVHPETTGNARTDEAMKKLFDQMNAWGDMDLLANGFEKRMRRFIAPYGEAEIKIASCPADDRISSVVVDYPRSAKTRRDFATIARKLTSTIGRSPDETTSGTSNLIVDWKFPDTTAVRAIYAEEAIRASGAIAPITVSYLGTIQARSCALNFIPKR